MRKRIWSLVMAIALVFMLAPAALAEDGPVLSCQFEGDSTARLTLEGLDGSAVYGVQIELTLDGKYTSCGFQPAAPAAYGTVKSSQDGNVVTVYLTDRAALNDGEMLAVGRLDFGGRAAHALHGTAKVILLGEDLRPMAASGNGTADVRVSAPEPAAPGAPAVPSRPSAPGETAGPAGPAQPAAPSDADISDTPYVPDMPVPSFDDVNPGDWFYEAVRYVYAHGIMRGTSDSTFAPYEPTSRAMIVTMLHRLEGEPAAASPAAFTDVPAGQYYAAPVAWASASGIVAGYEDGTFRPDVPITREQMAAILYRYAGYKGADVSVSGDLERFPDSTSVSGYALGAMRWAVGTGLITGSDGMLLPSGEAGRAQVAVMFQRLCEGILRGTA